VSQVGGVVVGKSMSPYYKERKKKKVVYKERESKKTLNCHVVVSYEKISKMHKESN